MLTKINNTAGKLFDCLLKNDIEMYAIIELKNKMRLAERTSIRVCNNKNEGKNNDE